MGLDTTHGCWHGAYSAFHRWRCELARVGGYPLKEGGASSRKVPAVWDLDWPDAAYQGEWDGKPPADPLLILLIHSDCDGLIPAEYAGVLADRLQGLLPLLPSDPAPGHIGDWRRKTETFIAGLRRAAAAGEPVEFW